jgi:hypothetical protein
MRRAFATEDLDADVWTALAASTGARRIDTPAEA